jgi:hypothetical protein
MPYECAIRSPVRGDLFVECRPTGWRRASAALTEALTAMGGGRGAFQDGLA